MKKDSICAVKNNKDCFLVSIVTPVYNGEAFFADTIKTVMNQTYAKWEWIIVDDGSTDGTRKILDGLKSNRIRIVSLRKGEGAAKARNTGVELAEGDFLCFLDADDLWVPKKLEKQIKFMKERKCAFSFTGYEFADADGKPNGKAVSVPSRINYKQALRNTTIWTSTVMFDMRLLSKEDIRMPEMESEDTATWWNVLKIVGCAYGLDEVLSYYRRSGRTLSSNKLVAIKRIWRLYRRHEKMDILSSFVNFVGYAVNAVRRRV